MRGRSKNSSNIIRNNTHKNNRQNSNSNSERNSGKNLIFNSRKENKRVIKKYSDFLEDPSANEHIASIKTNNKLSNFNTKKEKNDKEIKPKNIIISDDFPNGESFLQSDIEEIKSIFNQNDLKMIDSNGDIMDSSYLFDNSQDKKKEEITIKDLDPTIKDVLILFVLSSNYYELLVQERAKKAFNFVKKNKNDINDINNK
jgi:hypothetical protein